MAISNSSTILASDTNAMASTQLGLLATDNGQLPVGHYINLYFANVTATTSTNNPELSKSIIVVPFDCFIESLSVKTGSMTASSTTTVNVTAAGVFDSLPVQNTGVVGSGITSLARILYDNSKGATVGLYRFTNPALRLIPKLAQITVAATTTSVAATSDIQITLVLRSYFNRG